MPNPYSDTLLKMLRSKDSIFLAYVNKSEENTKSFTTGQTSLRNVPSIISLEISYCTKLHAFILHAAKYVDNR